jgi:serine O-acetyltransferase
MTRTDRIFEQIKTEAELTCPREPLLADFYRNAVLNHGDLASVLSYNLARQLCDLAISSAQIEEVIFKALSGDMQIIDSVALDLEATLERDAACDSYLTPILYFKGFQALQLYRVAHWLWMQDRKHLALFFQNQISQTFAVDIHPAAQIGAGIMVDHATGLVIGETAVIGNNVSILHSVTLGGSGAEVGDRHPKIGDGVLISAGAKILGNITIGEGVKIGAGSLVLESIPSHVTVAGVPAKIVGAPNEQSPALAMDQQIDGSS